MNHQIHPKVKFDTVRELLESSAVKYADRIAYSYRPKATQKENTTVTFAAFAEQVRALSSKLLQMGCAQKNCIIVAKLSYEWVLTYYAILSIGGIIVPLDREWTQQDLTDTAKTADAAFLFCDADIAEKCATIPEVCDLLAPTIYFGAKEDEHSLFALVEEGKALFAQNPDAYHNAPIDNCALALMVFTSGTTGKGKGVMLSQRAILADMYNVIHYIDFSQKSVGVLPPHHAYGSTVMFIGHMMIGSEIYLSSGLRYVQKELKEQQPGHLILVPLYLETFYRKIMATLKEKGKDKFVFHMIKLCNSLHLPASLRRKIFAQIHAAFGGKATMIISGGAPINQEILHFYRSIGINVLNGYGITECAPLISVNRSRHVVEGSIGDPIDEVEVKIFEPNEAGEGEIHVKGPNVMLGYYKNEQATKEAFLDGYFRTGDYGKLENGVLFITGRKKNLIILSNGKNVYPEEIENELTAIPGLLDVIVYEGQSKRGITYNAIVAEIYPDYDYLEKNGITDTDAYFKPYIDAFNRTAAPYKKIAITKVRREEFPKNALRKILRFKLDMTIE